MPLHPSEIATELRTFKFFDSFDEPMLLQIATMITTNSFGTGDLILRQGEPNHSLLFLRSGEVEILVDQERLMELSEAGEVLGEMSIISSKGTTATIRALSPVEVFCLNSQDLLNVHPSQVDRFQFLFYKVYAHILTERLSKTNAKAKLVESTARQLEQAKRELEFLSQAQKQLISSTRPMESQKKILFWDPLKKNHQVAKQALGGLGVQLEFQDLPADPSELPEADFFLIDQQFASHLPATFGTNTLLIFGTKPELTSLEQNLQVPFMITRDPEDRRTTTRMLLISLSKVLSQDIFGIEKYLNRGAEVRSEKVLSSAGRSQASETAVTYFRNMGLRSSMTDRIQVAAEELLMNAIYDAPLDSGGSPLYNHIPRSQGISLDPSQSPTLSYASDGQYAALSVEDPFGGLTRETILKYLRSIEEDKAGSLQGKKGGAGRGLHQIISSADIAIFNVAIRKKTEVICLWDLDKAANKVATEPSFHYFFVK